MLLSKPQLASKIRKYQNETDINTPNYVQGYTDLVRDHYSNFHTSTNTGMEFVRKQEGAVKEFYLWYIYTKVDYLIHIFNRTSLYKTVFLY
jgi:hypothetical protein